ncbi:unnamed protein product [Penicillium salamii]|uniref:Terpene cyclase/mutase family member n=1 Tax=Penicillium salamii TaxID=1612424 RepID=A0A9W4J2D7_9EURO|nr:unnamed protein product [Penicillium salamii]CAG8363089.1 unnamed protein product [Penicillium salamii]CAG8365647.1 unnamed protein product [Penicillium salamii]CAG8385529.1 unnamed protein product [Penicillium salamii]
MAESDFGSLATEAKQALHRAAKYSHHRQHDDGHWCGELKSNATITAEYVMLRQALGLDMESDRNELISWFLSEQNGDGSWSLAPGLSGDISTSVEAYFALKIMGVQPDTASMRKARSFITSIGGIAKVRIFTRIYLATFGLFPWSAVPELPAELIMMPNAAFISIYRLASWARSTIVPLLIISHHRPIYSLPNGRSAANDFLDELWDNPATKNVPYSLPLWELSKKIDVIASTFVVIDKILHALGGLRNSPTRSRAREQCVSWILQHQEPEGDWAGIFPPMHTGILALCLEGYALDDPSVKKGLQAIERFSWSDKRGKRIQACVSPVWDTILSTIGLCDANLPSSDTVNAMKWVKQRQLCGPEGDWRIYQPKITAGGFSFEYFNRWYPDVDDTAAAILGMVKEDAKLTNSHDSIVRAVQWILGMQNNDGGWGAFDIHNDRLFLNKIPFSDMEALCDPSTADVTGRILEAFGLLFQSPNQFPVDLIYDMKLACDRAIRYLLTTQELNGSWYGRWGTNYIYGTSNVICGLAFFSDWENDKQSVMDSTERATTWLTNVQNPDGGWGETLLSYRKPELGGHGSSTASQTVWALMAILTRSRSHKESIKRGVAYLLRTQTLSDRSDEASWPETQYTGTGFPNHFYLGYSLYSHYFPMMALGRYVRLSSADQ